MFTQQRENDAQFPSILRFFEYDAVMFAATCYVIERRHALWALAVFCGGVVVRTLSHALWCVFGALRRRPSERTGSGGGGRRGTGSRPPAGIKLCGRVRWVNERRWLQSGKSF